jgi:hypothetical protein
MTISKIKTVLGDTKYACTGWICVPHKAIQRVYIAGYGQSHKQALLSAFRVYKNKTK